LVLERYGIRTWKINKLGAAEVKSFGNAKGEEMFTFDEKCIDGKVKRL
jgi:hypothetical protein